MVLANFSNFEQNAIEALPVCIQSEDFTEVRQLHSTIQRHEDVESKDQLLFVLIVIEKLKSFILNSPSGSFSTKVALSIEVLNFNRDFNTEQDV